MIDTISVLGSTGSVGTQSLRAARQLGVRVAAIAARGSIELLEAQAREFGPQIAAVYDEAAGRKLALALRDTGVRVVTGEGGLMEAAAVPAAQAVVTAVSGSIGLLPTLAAIDEKKRVCLANKETLVCAGALVMARARERGSEIIPVDSEHSAIFQCLAGRERGELRRILLTGSGGPFRGWSRERTAAVTPQMAVRHPNWHMGAKISVDSATMMNKGLEFIEAMHLFDTSPDKIKILVHPQSVVHSMVELCDGAVIAQLAVPDMLLPIQYALTWPERRPAQAAALDFAALAPLTFEEPDLDALPCLRLALSCAKTGGTAPAVLSAANEEAVALFLAGKMGYNEIFDCVAGALSGVKITQAPSLRDILEADRAAREYVKEVFSCM